MRALVTVLAVCLALSQVSCSSNDSTSARGSGDAAAHDANDADGSPADTSDDVMCDEGQWCDGVCVEPGDGAAGEPCERGSECESGPCELDVCQKRCRVNADCPDDVACTRDGICDKWGAVCEEEMHPDGILCRDDYVPHICYRSSDCPEGDCLASPLDKSGGHCDESGEIYCKEDEFRDNSFDPFCRIPETCGNDGHCPDGYECVEDYVETQGRPDGVSWCSRRVADWPWPP